jgi:transcription antitermination factor NusG
MYSVGVESSQANLEVEIAFFQPRWYAAYTAANHENRVQQQLEQRRVDSFLPVYEVVRQWKDRRKRLLLPLFPGYVFVRLALMDRLRVLQVPGVVYLVGFNRHPVPLADEEVLGLKRGLAAGIRTQPHPFLAVGRRCRIKSGPLEGTKGILLRRKSGFRIVLSIELIRRSVVIDVDAADVEPVSP